MATKIWVGTDVGNVGDWSVAANWSPTGVPVSADDVYLEYSSQSVTSGFAQSAVDLDSLNIAQHYTGSVGTSSAYLAIGAAVCRVGYNDGPGTATGSPLIKIDFGINQTALTVENAGTSADTDKPPIRILNVNASSTVEVRKGGVGIAFDTGEVSTVGDIGTSFITNRNTDAQIYIGEGVTATNLNMDGGTVKLDGAAALTSLIIDVGALTTIGAVQITTINQRGGTCTYNSIGTIATLNITGGIADFKQSLAARTVTNLTLEAGGRLSYDTDVLTVTNGVTSTRPIVYSAT